MMKDFETFAEALYDRSSKDYYYIGFSICVLGHLTLGLRAWIAAPFQILATWSGRLFTFFCFLALVLSPISTAPQTSAVFAVATWGVYILLFLYWRSDYRAAQQIAVLTGIVLLIWLYLMWFKHGLSFGFGSSIGGLNRNTIGEAGVGGMILCSLSPKKAVRWAALGACVLIALAVDSRGSLVAISNFVLAYYILNKGTVRGAVHVMVALCVIWALFLIVPSLNQILFNDILQLNSAARGTQSGFSGRTDIWRAAIAKCWRRPVFGYGFRTGGFGAHNGYIILFAETGLLGFFTLLTCVVTEAVRRFRIVSQFREIPPATGNLIDIAETIRVNSVAFAAITTMMCVWLYEMLCINIGTVICVVFLLMLVAPSHVVKSGGKFQ
jgi:O-antigen ligase